MLAARMSAPSLRLDAAEEVQKIVSTLEYQLHTQLRRRNFIVALSGGGDSSVVQRARAYVDEHCLYARGSASIDDDASLLSPGVIDSLGVMELLMLNEQESGIVAADDELTDENLGSFSGIANRVGAKFVTVSNSPTKASDGVADRAR